MNFDPYSPQTVSRDTATAKPRRRIVLAAFAIFLAFLSFMFAFFYVAVFLEGWNGPGIPSLVLAIAAAIGFVDGVTLSYAGVAFARGRNKRAFFIAGIALFLILSFAMLFGV